MFKGKDKLGKPVPEQTHAHTQPFNGLWSGTTWVGRYQKKHSPNHTHPDHQTSFIIFLHLQRSTASSLFNLSAWQSSLTTSLKVLFGLPLGLGPCHFILHAFLHPVIIFFSQHMPIPSQSQKGNKLSSISKHWNHWWTMHCNYLSTWWRVFSLLPRTSVRKCWQYLAMSRQPQSWDNLTWN